MQYLSEVYTTTSSTSNTSWWIYSFRRHHPDWYLPFAGHALPPDDWRSYKIQDVSSSTWTRFGTNLGSTSEVMDLFVWTSDQDCDGSTSIFDVSWVWSGIRTLQHHESSERYHIWSCGSSTYWNRIGGTTCSASQDDDAETTGWDDETRYHAWRIRDCGWVGHGSQHYLELWWRHSSHVCFRYVTKRILWSWWQRHHVDYGSSSDRPFCFRTSLTDSTSCSCSMSSSHQWGQSCTCCEK